MHERAAESIEFIRETMVRSASFTAVPGQGGVAMGAIGVLTAVLASQTTTPERWLATWLVAAVVAAPIGLAATIMKARRHHVALWSASGRRFMQGFLPAIVAGAALTVALVRADRIELLPPTWLLLYGAGILAGATASISVLTWVGACSWRSASRRWRPSVSGRTCGWARGLADCRSSSASSSRGSMAARRGAANRHAGPVESERPGASKRTRPTPRRRRRRRRARSISID